jgi:ATP-binding cassette subfamily F protein 3
MLLRPSNTLLLDEPTNHLDLDSKDVLLEALEDFGGTLIFVSHDRYFVDKLASKVIEIRDGQALLYPGNYEEWLWSRKQREEAEASGQGSGVRDQGAGRKSVAGGTPKAPSAGSRPRTSAQPPAPDPQSPVPEQSYDERKRRDSEARKVKKAADGLRKRVEELEARIAERETAIKSIEASMSTPGFYDDREAAQPLIDRHQALMWEVGDLMNQWEALQTEL